MNPVAIGVSFDDKSLSLTEEEHFAVRPVAVVAYQSDTKAGYPTAYRRDVVQWIQGDLNVLAPEVGNMSSVDVVGNCQINHA